MHLHVLKSFYIFNIYTCIAYAYSCIYMHDNMYLHVYTCMTCAFFKHYMHLHVLHMNLHVLHMYLQVLYMKQSTCIINIYMDYI